MKIGDTVRVTDNALHLWQDDDTLLTPALLVHLGAPNVFTVKDLTADGTGEYVVLACCRAFKIKGDVICSDHPAEFFEACESGAPVNDGAEDASTSSAPVHDSDAETSVSVPVLGKIAALGYVRGGRGKISLKIPGIDEFAVEGAAAGILAKLLKGTGIL